VRAAGAILLAALGWLVPACGEDDEPVRPPPGQATPAPAGGAAAGPPAGAAPPGAPGAGKQLVPQVSIEDRVVCRVVSDAKKKCDPKSPRCEKPGEHCITSTEGSFCGPCPERDAIRRPFRPRDFAATFDTRDPFQSFIVPQPGLDAAGGAGASGSGGDDGKASDPAKRCTREEQLVAQGYSYQDLKLVGIVTQGLQRKVLMLDSTNLGHIIKRGDCVGRERAVVKEIGKEFITFELRQEVAGPGGRREPEQRSVQLYPKQIPVTSLPSEQPAGAPVGPPPQGPPPQGPPPAGQGGAPTARPGTRIQVVPPPQQAPAVAPQAPTTLRP
jgi:hypothetical protein